MLIFEHILHIWTIDDAAVYIIVRPFVPHVYYLSSTLAWSTNHASKIATFWLVYDVDAP
jgi:hypothetical protein